MRDRIGDPGTAGTPPDAPAPGSGGAGPPRGPRGPLRLGLYGLLVVAVSLALLEGGARAVLLALPGAWPSRAEMRASLVPAGGGPRRAAAPGPEGEVRGVLSHEVHPYVGYVRNPALGRQVMNGRVITQPVNPFGFYGPAIPAAAPEGTVVVAVTGGSVALELTLYAREALTAALEAGPAFRGRKVEVVSLALGGFKQPQQLMALNYFLVLGLRPDVLINLDGFNEVTLPPRENLPFGVAPFYPRAWGVLAAQVVGEAGDRLLEAAQARRALERRRSLFSSFPLRHSTFALMLWDRLRAGPEARIRALDRALLAQGTAAASVRNVGPSVTYDDDAAMFRDLAGLWARASAMMDGIARSHGIAYFHFLQPNQYVPGSKVLTDEERRRAFQKGSYRTGVLGGYPRLREAGAALAEAGVPFYDLTGLFAREPGTVYRDPCCHLTDEANAVLARAIARVVNDRLARPGG